MEVLSRLVKVREFRHIHAVILRFIVSTGLVWLAYSLPAAPLRLDSLKVGSRVYSNVTVVGANTTDLYFTHNQGIANVKLKYVDESLRTRFHYDPKAAAEAERQQDVQDSAYQTNLVSMMVAQAQKAAQLFNVDPRLTGKERMRAARIIAIIALILAVILFIANKALEVDGGGGGRRRF